MSDTVTILHMTLTFITSMTVALLGYLRFKDSRPTDEELENRLTTIEKELQRKKNKKH